MRSPWRAALYGLAVWAIPFVVAVLIKPLRDSNRGLFESIMPITVAAVAAFLGWSYFRRVHRHYVREGLLLGLLWLAVCVIVDLPLMLSPPMSWTVGQYVADVGLTYLIIPIITTAMGVALHSHPETVRQRLIRIDRSVEVPEFVPQL